MKTRPEISDHEIQSMMDFDKVLDIHRHARKRGKLLWSTVILGGVAVVLIGWQLLKPAEQEQTILPEEKPVIAKDSSTIVPEAIIPGTKREVKKETPVVAKEKPKPEVKTESSSYTEAEPVNGYPDLYAYFQKELKYPVEALKDSIEGIVSVSFVINKDGKPEQVKILNSLGTAFDNEAIRVITGMPEWKPAAMNGKPVPVRISMPLTFQVNKLKSHEQE